MASKVKSKMIKLTGLNERVEGIDGTLVVDANGPVVVKKLIAQCLAMSRTPEDAVPAYKLALRTYDEEDEALFTSEEIGLIRKCIKAADAMSNLNRAVIEMTLDAGKEVEVEEKKK